MAFDVVAMQFTLPFVGGRRAIRMPQYFQGAGAACCEQTMCLNASTGLEDTGFNTALQFVGRNEYGSNRHQAQPLLSTYGIALRMITV